MEKGNRNSSIARTTRYMRAAQAIGGGIFVAAMLLLMVLSMLGARF